MAVVRCNGDNSRHRPEPKGQAGTVTAARSSWVTTSTASPVAAVAATLTTAVREDGRMF